MQTMPRRSVREIKLTRKSPVESGSFEVTRLPANLELARRQDWPLLDRRLLALWGFFEPGELVKGLQAELDSLPVDHILLQLDDAREMVGVT